MHSISKEIKRILNEEIQGFDVTGYEDDDVINHQTIKKVADPNNELPYIELKEACEDTPELDIEKPHDKRYIAQIFFRDYFYRILDNKSGIGSQGSTWLNVSPTFYVTIVAIGGCSGRRYTKNTVNLKLWNSLLNN